jgi:polyphosphate glucokinase
MRVLVVDIGGTNVKILATGQTVARRLPSGPSMTPAQMVAGVKKLAADWRYDVVSIGYPGPVLLGHPISEPHNLGKGWVHFDYRKAFNWPVQIVNDAALQALGSYKKGKMLFLGLGTGLGSALVTKGVLKPMEIGQLPYQKGVFEDYVGKTGLEKRGLKIWRHHVEIVVKTLIKALDPTDVVIGGGNVKRLTKLPPLCRAGDNANAFVGGFRLWQGWSLRQILERQRAQDEQIKRGAFVVL